MTLERTIAGHRVLRLLGRGSRSRVWLVPHDRVLKVLAAPVDPGQPGREAQALHRARDEHVVELLDVSVQPDEIVLVHPRLPRGSLAEVLGARRALDAGEAVTILAPLAAALARMHGAGVAHGAVSAEHVLFRSDGAPVLIGFGAATLFDEGLPEVTRERIDGVIADRRALAALARQVLARVDGPRASAAAAFADSLDGPDLRDLEARLARGLFELAAARPVVFEADDMDAVDGRAIAVAHVPEPAPPPPGSRFAQLLESGPATVVRRYARDLWTSWSPVRRRVVIGGVTALLVVVFAVAAIPPSSSSLSSPSLSTSDEVVPDAGTSPDSALTDAEQAPTGVGAVTADDPIEAVSQLLRRRDECLRDLSVLCLADVDETGSAAFEDDRQAIQSVIETGQQPPKLSSVGARLIERLGDSALIDVSADSDPASVLLMKGEAGWRIRDYLAGSG